MLSPSERRFLEEEARTGDFSTRRAARELLLEASVAASAPSASAARLSRVTPSGSAQAPRKPRTGRVSGGACIAAVLFCSAVAFQAGSASWALGAARSMSSLARGLGLWGPRAYARPAAHALGGGSADAADALSLPRRAAQSSASPGGGASADAAVAGSGSASRARTPPSFLASVLPDGHDAAGDVAGSHAWLTHQRCFAGADEAEMCEYRGPLCTDGNNVYVSAREVDAAWPPMDTRAVDASWPPPTGTASHTACWDVRNLEATEGCGYSDPVNRRAPVNAGGGAGAGATAWTTPLGSRADKGGWGPAGLQAAVIPLHWSVFADALHAGPHKLTDPTAHLVRLGAEWESPLQSTENADGGGLGDLEERAAAGACAHGGAGPAAAAQGRGTGDDPALELHWLDGPLWLTPMAVGWLGHPWHFSTSAFPLWAAKRRNATTLHVPRGRRDGQQTTASRSPPSTWHSTKTAHSDDALEDTDDGSAASELLLSAGGAAQLPPMRYVSFLQSPVFEGLDDRGRLKGVLGDETPGRTGRGLADLSSWIRGVWRLLTEPPDADGEGGTTLLTRRTLAMTLGVSTSKWGEPRGYNHTAQTPRPLYDVGLACSGRGSGGTAAHAHAPVPRLVCSAHGSVLLGLQPRLFAGVADANAFRVAAWERAGVLRARADAEAVDAQILERGDAVAKDGSGTRANAFLRGKKRKRARSEGDAAKGGGGGLAASAPAPDAPPADASVEVRWWDVYPPRSITVVTRQGTRNLTPQKPLRALLRHVGLPVRWMTGLGSRTWDEQVAVLSGTGIFLSAHGGDLVGIPFLPPSAAVIEAFPYLMDFEGYRHLADATGARYTRLIAPPPTHPDEIAEAPSGAPLGLPTNDVDAEVTWRTSAYEALLEQADFETYCEDPQRVPSLDAAQLVACNGRSKNIAVELDWPALVGALTAALDDIGCRPRQFTAAQARAIRAAQADAGLADTLWEGWRELAESPPPPMYDPLGARSDALSSTVDEILRALGLEEGDIVEPDGELWGGSPDVYFDVGRKAAPRPTAVNMSAHEALLKRRGIPMKNIRLEDVHLVPVTGGDGAEGARLPYVNVRAACAPRDRVWRDKSPW